MRHTTHTDTPTSNLLRRAVAFVGSLVMAASIMTSTADAHDRHQIDWTLEDCDAVIALIPIDAGRVQARLPDGFTATVPPSVRRQLPPDMRLEAVLGLEAFTCREGSGLDGPISPMSYASHWTFADPPRYLGQDHHDLTFVKWDTLIPDGDRRRLLRQHGLPARDGTVTFDLFEPDTRSVSTGPGVVGSELDEHLNDAPEGVAFDVALEFGRGESYRFTGATTDDTTFRGDLVEYSPADGHGGLATWTAHYEAATTRAGTGTIQLDPEGAPARMLSATTTDAYYLTATGLEFTEGTINLPAEPATDGRQTREPRDPTLQQQAEQHLEQCRDATDRTWWRLLLEIGHECVREPAGTIQSVIDQTAGHADDCRHATEAMWWKIGHELKRQCAKRPVATVQRWIGTDDMGPDSGVLP